jgi:protein arginine kinase
MEFSKLLGHTCEWLKGTGAESDIVLSTRVRLARNLKGFPFPARASTDQLQDIQRLIHEKTSSLAEFTKGIYLSLDQLAAVDLYLLFERHLISKEHAQSSRPRALLFSEDERVSLMINEEDHFRLQIIHSGWEVRRLWQETNHLDDAMASVFSFAFHSRFGYLTACPTNVGTGLRVSVMLHLPALRMSNQMEKIQQAAHKVNLAFRGFYGEGSGALGDFFQLSNQVTLGKTEEEICRILVYALPQIIKYEREVRQTMRDKHSTQLTKLVQGAYETLRQTTAISGDVAMSQLSAVRMGVHLGLLPLSIEDVNRLFILSQPAHLQKKEGKDCTAQERDLARAELFRSSLN